ncbi:streptophobe family protein [Streptacidiphilus monticola]|uniref:Streptophobe family protein n=1 Tax=Streptacidiphilus monticola TaxID=2161674 RepID=A0ABW1G2L5_9ACTN
MTVYGYQRPTGAGSLVRGVIWSALAASWAVVAMAAVGALGVHLLGLDKYADLGGVTAALVAMAVGGKVSPTGDVSVFGLDAAQAQADIGIVPLGLTVVGALVLGRLFVRPLGRLGRLEVAELAARALSAVVAFLVLIALVAWAGNGTVTVKLDSLTGSGSSGSSGSSGGDPLGGLGDLGGLLGGIVGGNTKPTVGFKVDLGPTLGWGLLWVVGVLVVAYLASRRAALPAAWAPLARQVRPAVSTVVTLLTGAIAVGALAGVVVGLTGNGGARTIGGVLLGTPNGVFLALPLGMFVPLTGKASGLLTQFLPAPVNQLLKGGSGQSITVPHLAQLDGRVWLLPVAVALFLLACGVMAAVRTPRPVLPESLAKEAGGTALRLGVVLAVAVPLMLALAEVSINADVGVFGIFSVKGSGVSISGNLGLGFVLGLVEGAVFGFLGTLLVRRFAEPKRAPAPVGGPTPPPPAPYGGLPQAPLPPRPTANPYAPPASPPVAPPPQDYNPYAGGPTQAPPPPPEPPR